MQLRVVGFFFFLNVHGNIVRLVEKSVEKSQYKLLQ